MVFFYFISVLRCLKTEDLELRSMFIRLYFQINENGTLYSVSLAL